jgi:hypothetical protein
MLNSKLKEAIADPIMLMDKDAVEHFELLVDLAKSDKAHR